MDQAAISELASHVKTSLADEVSEVTTVGGEVCVETRPEYILPVLTFLKEDGNCRFHQLLDVAGVDYPERSRRFEVVYHLLSMSHNQRIRVRIRTNEETPVPSATGLYASANWYEREVWDMYGVKFSDHPDLRRILTDYGFSGFPLRKDFPLTGHVQVRYSESEKRVVYEPVTLRQDFRDFDFISPWEGADYVRAAREKAESQAEGSDNEAKED